MVVDLYKSISFSYSSQTSTKTDERNKVHSNKIATNLSRLNGIQGNLGKKKRKEKKRKEMKIVPGYLFAYSLITCCFKLSSSFSLASFIKSYERKKERMNEQTKERRKTSIFQKNNE